LGNTPKMTIRKSGPASEFLENFIEKRRYFSRKTLFCRKAGRPYHKKARKICRNFCIFEKSGEFFRFWISEAATLLDDFEKYTKNFDLRFFTKKSWWAEKGEIHFFKKSRFFAKKVFAIFYCGGLMPKWKNKVEKCPVRNIIFCV
jgi:hypothetical protein